MLGKRQSLDALADENWDLVVIGGGITGAGVLLEAARRGLRVLLLEQTDFAWGTSSRSSKMVHGGLRYIAQGDIRLTRHSLLERERLIDDYEETFANPYRAAALGYLDDVIQPRETRAKLSRALGALLEKEEIRPARKHGNIPL